MLRNALSIVVCLATLLVALLTALVAAPRVQSSQEDSAKISADDAKKLKNPVSFSKESIAKGRALYIQACTECHGSDGKSLVDVIANATDLTDPKFWKSGTSDGEIYRSIRDGAGEAMPPFKAEISKDEDLWHLVNFLRSLWPEPMRPKLADSAN